MVRREKSTLAILEKAYELETNEEAWLQALSDAALPSMDAGLGTFGFRAEPATGKLLAFVTSQAPSWLPQSIVGIHAASSRSERAVATGKFSRYCALSESFGRDTWLGLELTAQHILAHGFEDVISINLLDPAGKYLLVVGAAQKKIRTASKVEVGHWTRVSSHLGAAWRLRSRLVGQHEEGEAILAPSGAVEHATADAKAPSARETLRAAVRNRERALASSIGKLSREPLDLWKGLVEGRWSLVDRFDSDGRRYVVAHANRLAAPGPRALTDRERDVAAMAAVGAPLKVIAYELGLSIPRVSNLLTAALRRIGAASRAELARIYAASLEAQAHSGITQSARVEPRDDQERAARKK